MKKTFIFMLVGMAMLVAGSLRAQEATMQTCEYWWDYDFEHRQTVAMGGNGLFQQQFDLSSLPRGLHSVGLRFADSKGRWTAPLVKHFVIPALSAQTFDDNRIVGMEYWLDYDFKHREALQNTNGTVALTLDLSALSPGLHSIAYRALDSRGIWLSPLLKHFVIPGQPEPAITGMAAYEYWFNHGPRVRVEVEKQSMLELSNVAIEVKDVKLDAVPADFTFKAEEETAYCPDSVFFGIQAMDDAGHPSSAVASQWFFFDVPVDPHFLTLTSEQPVGFAAPEAGAMQGFKVTGVEGDDIDFTLSSGGEFRLYDANGQAAECAVTTGEGTVTYRLKANTATMYALLWNVPIAMDTMQMVFTHHVVTDVNADSASDGIRVTPGKGTLDVTMTAEARLQVFAANGTEIFNGFAVNGTHRLTLSAGAYIVRANGRVIKTFVR